LRLRTPPADSAISVAVRATAMAKWAGVIRKGNLQLG